MPVSGTEHLNLDQKERDYHSTRQDSAHSHQGVLIVTEERNRGILSMKSLRVELLGEPAETTYPCQAQ